MKLENLENGAEFWTHLGYSQPWQGILEINNGSMRLICKSNKSYSREITNHNDLYLTREEAVTRLKERLFHELLLFATGLMNNIKVLAALEEE